MEKRILTDEEVRALKTVLIKGNEQIIAVLIKSGYCGRGGSNSSPYTEDMNCTLSLERLEGPPYEVFGMQIRAIVNDIIYLINPSNGCVFSFGVNGKFEADREVAYDTVEFCLIAPVVKKP